MTIKTIDLDTTALTLDALLAELDADTQIRLTRGAVIIATVTAPFAPPTPEVDYATFLRTMYGALRDSPIERGDQGEYEVRESL